MLKSKFESHMLEISLEYVIIVDERTINDIF
jgi:hypothetical protein